MDPLIQKYRQNMQKVMEVLRTDLSTVRTGRATPTLVENVIVSVYGGSTRLKVMEVATISASDPQTLLIVPFDGSIIGEIQKGIGEANIGLTPVIDGAVIRIPIPPLSTERREQLIHLMKQKLENGRIMIRQERHEAMLTIKKEESNKNISEDKVSRLEKEVQKITDDMILEIDLMGKKKEQELLQI